MPDRKAYIVRHPDTGIWEFIMATTQQEAEKEMLVRRLTDFVTYAMEQGYVIDPKSQQGLQQALSDIERTFDTTVVGQETKLGIDFYDTRVEL